MRAFGRGSPPKTLAIPIAHQCTPYAVNATAAMYSGLSVNEPNHVRPTNRITPATNWRNPGIHMPQIPVWRPHSLFGGGKPATPPGPQIREPAPRPKKPGPRGKNVVGANLH